MVADSFQIPDTAKVQCPHALRSLISILLLSVLISSALSQSADLDSKSAALDELFAVTNAGKNPGAAAIVVRQGTVLREKWYCLADLEGNTPIKSNSTSAWRRGENRWRKVLKFFPTICEPPFIAFVDNVFFRDVHLCESVLHLQQAVGMDFPEG